MRATKILLKQLLIFAISAVIVTLAFRLRGDGLFDSTGTNVTVNVEEPVVYLITPRRGLTLHPNTEREDFLKFELEFNSHAPASNQVIFTMTNTLLTLDQLTAVPSGRSTMGIRSVYADGEVSETAIYQVAVWRGKPPKPSVKPTALSDPVEAKGTRGFESGRPARNLSPIQSARSLLPPSTNSPPLPGGTAVTYGDHSDLKAEEMLRHYRKSGRRNE
jgi:hypothetical protein